jgi:hypothetical protein
MNQSRKKSCPEERGGSQFLSWSGISPSRTSFSVVTAVIEKAGAIWCGPGSTFTGSLVGIVKELLKTTSRLAFPLTCLVKRRIAIPGTKLKDVVARIVDQATLPQAQWRRLIPSTGVRKNFPLGEAFPHATVVFRKLRSHMNHPRVSVARNFRIGEY